eukprot:m.428631 g.428631  ORF g.428631 m.428631 type:complete len:3311 (+) comp20233_c0_seq24:244-10176(+)
MFESLLASNLNKYLTPYLNGIGKEQLKLGVWSGDLNFAGLSLKPEVVEDLGLPMTIVDGYIGNLKLQIPWKQLFPSPTKPVVAVVTDLFLLLGPKLEEVYDPEKSAKLQKAIKQKRLQGAEAAKEAAKNADQETDSSFSSRLVASIINNIQVRVENIHIRYEDATSNPGHPFAFGITLSSLSAESTNEKWEAAFLKGQPTFVHKLVDQDSFSIYLNTDVKDMLTPLPVEEKRKRMRELIPRAGRPVDHQYLLAPVSLQVKVVLNTKGESANAPQTTAAISIFHFGICLDQDQYNDVLFLADAASRFARQHSFLHLRPRIDRTTKDGLRAWWAYAINSHLEGIHKKKETWSWEFFRKRRDARVAYIGLYKNYLLKNKSDKKMLERLTAMEDDIGTEDILRYRQLAEAQVPESEREKASSWFGGWFGGSKKKGAAGDTGDAPKQGLSEEERKAFYSAIGYSEGQTAEQVKSGKYVALTVDTNVTMTSLKLLPGKRQFGDRRFTEEELEALENALVEVKILNIAVGVKQRPASEGVDVGLDIGSLLVADETAAGAASTFPMLLQPKKVDRHTRDTGEALLSLQFELNPLDKKVDSFVSLRTRPLEIVYRAQTLTEIIAFFEKPAGIRLDDLANAASIGLQTATEQSRAGLIHAIETHTTLGVDVVLSAPTIVVPAEERCIVLAADLGIIAVTSEIQLRDRPLETLDLAEYEQYVYDRFRIELTGVQVVLAADDTMEAAERRLRRALAIEGDTSDQHVLNKLGLKLLVQQCLLPDDVRFAALKAEGELSPVMLRVSDKKIKLLQSLAEVVGPPEFPDSEPAATEPALEPLPGMETVAPSSSVPLPTAMAAAATAADAPGKSQEAETTAVSPSSNALAFAAEDDYSDDDFQSLSEADNDTEDEFAATHAPAPVQPTASTTSLALSKRVGIAATFAITHVGVVIERWDAQAKEHNSLLQLGISDLAVEKFEQRPDEMFASVCLRDLSLIDYTSGEEFFMIQSNPSQEDTKLISIAYQAADESNPRFAETFDSTKQDIKATFQDLNIVVRKESVATLLKFASSLTATDEAASIESAADDTPAVTDTDQTVDDATKEGQDEQDDKVIATSSANDLRFNGSFSSLRVALETQKNGIGELIISGITTQATLAPASTMAFVQLAQLQLNDTSRHESLHRSIVSIVGEEVFSATVVLNNLAPKSEDRLMPDIDVDFKLNALRFVYLARFVQDLVDFTTCFSAAELPAAATQGGEVATAPTPPKEAEDKPTAPQPKVDLNVSIAAPQIVVPMASNSTRVFFLDFGNIAVGNSLALVQPAEATTIPPVLDAMTVELNELQAYICDLAADGAVDNKSVVIRPIRIGLSVDRCLDSEFHEVAAIDVKCQIDEIQMDLSDGDLTELLSITTGNLAEVKPAEGSDAAVAASAATNKKQSSQKQLQGAEDAEDAEDVQPNPAETFAEPVIWNNLVASVNLPLLSLNLAKGHEELATLALEAFDIAATITSDSAINAKVKLQELTITDTRPYEPKHFPHMLTSERGDLPYFDVTFAQVGDEMLVVAAVNKTRVTLAPDFLLALQAFPPTSETSDEPVVDKPAEGGDNLAALAETDEDDEAPKEAAPPSGGIKIYLTVDDAKITVVADHMDQHTPSMYLALDSRISFATNATQQNLDCRLSNLRIDSFRPKFRARKFVTVLQPCNIEVTLSTELKNNQQHAIVSINDIDVEFGAGDLDTINSVLAALSPPTDEPEETLPTTASLWGVRDVDTGSWYVASRALMRRASSAILPSVETVDEGRENSATISIGSIDAVVVDDFDGAYRPLLMLSMAISASLRGFGGELQYNPFLKVVSTISLTVANYNPKVSCWEPLLEPLSDSDTNRLEPWPLKVAVTMANKRIKRGDADSGPQLLEPPPDLTCAVGSETPLELTVTQAFLQVVTESSFVAGDAVTKAADNGHLQLAPRVVEDVSVSRSQLLQADGPVSQAGFERQREKYTGFRIHNDTGHNVKYAVMGQEAPEVVGLLAGVSRALELPKAASKDGGMKALKLEQWRFSQEITVEVEGWEPVDEVQVNAVGSYCYVMKSAKLPYPVALVVEVSMQQGEKVITLRSSLQVFNRLGVPVEIAYDGPGGPVAIANVRPHETYNVPLAVAHRSGLRALPAGLDYEWCTELMQWTGARQQEMMCISRATSNTEQQAAFRFFATLKPEVYSDRRDLSRLRYSPRHAIVLTAPLMLRNFLPEAVQLKVVTDNATIPDLELSIEPSQEIPVYVDSKHKTVLSARCEAWGGADSQFGEPTCIFGSKKSPSALTMVASDGRQLKLGLNRQLHARRGQDNVLTIFSPYWIVNQTGRHLTLSQKGDSGATGVSLCQCPPDVSTPILFSFPNSVSGLSKTRAQLQVAASHWSDALNLDTVGHSGVISCPRGDDAVLPWQVCMTVEMTFTGFSKIVTFRPRFVVFNRLAKPLLCANPQPNSELPAADADGVESIAPGACSAFWPLDKMCRILAWTKECVKAPVPIKIDQPRSVPLRMIVRQDGAQQNSIEVSNVAVRADQAASLIDFNPDNGVADLRIENRCSFPISFMQCKSKLQKLRDLDPGTMMLYVRDDAEGAAALEITLHSEDYTTGPITQDMRDFGVGKVRSRSGGAELVIACFPDGAQPVLVLSDQPRVAHQLARASGLERAKLANSIMYENVITKFTLAFHHIGISVVDGKPSELLYFSFNPRDVWEYMLDVDEGPDAWGDEWKRLSLENQQKVKNMLAEGQPELDLGSGRKVQATSDGALVYCAEDRDPQPLRKTSKPAISVEYYDCKLHSAAKVDIEHVQLDNNLDNAVVPIILKPAGVKKRETVLPFIKMLFVQAKPVREDAPSVLLVHRMGFLMQRLDVAVTEQFLLAVADFASFGSSEVTVSVADDLEYVGRPLYADRKDTNPTERSYWKLFQLHPVSINLSFMLTPFEDELTEDNVVRNLLKAIGVALSNIEDVPIRLNSLMLENVFCTQQEFVLDIQSHFTSQVLMELYKVLGCLDFIGNPVRSFSHLTTGFSDLFYEPNVDGVLSAATGTLASATSAVSSIAGSVGNTLASLSMDEEYKKQRQLASARRKTAKDHLAFGGERLARGLVEGVGGLFLNPLQGAQEGGALGFFKGLGKGVVGVVAKPVGGIIDMTTSTLDIVDVARRNLQGDLDVERVRLPRVVMPDKVVTPYSLYEASGKDLLRSLMLHEQRLTNMFQQQDLNVQYVAHYVLEDPHARKAKRKQIVFFTDRMVLVMLASSFDLAAAASYDRLTNVAATSKGVMLSFTDGPKNKKKKYLLPSSKEQVQRFLASSIQKYQGMFT